MSDDQRIQQFRQMADSDPSNELGHFSLGRALLEAGQPEEAGKSLGKAVELNPRMSKGFQLLAQALDATGQRQKAVEAATRGAQVADEQGDRMPRDAMVDMLKSWDAPVPLLSSPDPAETAPTGDGPAVEGFRCARCGRPGGQLAKSPLPGKVGQTVFDHTCEQCWKEWLGMGTKVINELGLVLTTPEGAAVYDQYMLEFLQLEGR
ncbi:MAG: Fe(2+)-trafficking protein [Phycisphaerae bacterium]